MDTAFSIPIDLAEGDRRAVVRLSRASVEALCKGESTRVDVEIEREDCAPVRGSVRVERAAA